MHGVQGVQGELVDGRRARRDRNVEAVIDAVVELIGEGDLRPGVADIAQRSGVSPRSLFRYFDDLTELQATALARHAELVGDLFEPLDDSGSRARRIERFVEHRLHQYDLMAPYARAAITRAPFTEAIRDGLRSRRTALRRQIEALFAKELARSDATARRDVVDALEAATAFEAIESVRVERRRSRANAARVLALTVDRLLR